MKFIKELKDKINEILITTKTTLSFLHRVEKLLHRVEKSVEPPILTIARHTLGSIDLKDVTNPDNKAPEEYVEYTAQAMQFYNFFEKEAEWIMKLQHDYWFTHADGENQMYFGRGTTNGIQLLLDRFKLLKDTHLQNIKKEEELPLGSREEILARLQGSNEPVNEVEK